MKIMIKGMKIGAFDYGKKRIGFAVCDEFHITSSPRKMYDAENALLWDEILRDIQSENLGAVVVGMPLKYDGSSSSMTVEIEEFAKKIEEISGLNVYFQDEAYSTVRAVETMIEIGKKKGKRREKGAKDKIAAAIILREFLSENEV